MFQHERVHELQLAEQRLSARLERRHRLRSRRGAAAIRLSVRREARAHRSH